MNYILTQFSKHFSFILIAVNLVVFGQVITHQLVWDDHAFVINQNHHQPATFRAIINGSFPVPDTGSYRPVRNALYAITLPVFKDNPVYHHGFILALHLICCFQIFHFIKPLTGQFPAQLGALLFAVHPIHTENINWVTAGYDLIFAVFYLGTLLAHRNYQSGHSNRRWLPYVLSLLALFSNEIALTLPAVIMLLDYYAYRTSLTQPENRATYSLYWLTAGIFWFVRMIFITQNPFSVVVYPEFVKNLFLGVFLFGHYLLQLFLPLSLSVDRLFLPGLSGLYSLNHNLTHPPPDLNFLTPAVLIPGLLSLIWFGLILVSLAKKSLFSLPLIWVPLSLLPVLRIVPLPAIYAERYAYVASIGFILLLTLWLKSLAQKPTLKTPVVLVFCLYFSYFAFVSFQRSQDWRNDFVLWTKTIAQNPQSAPSASSLGVQYFIQGDLVNSLKYHQLSITLNPYVSSYQQNYVSLLAKLERWDDIIAFVGLIQKTDTKNINLYTILASTYDARGDYHNAMANYQKAYDLSPAYSPRRREIEDLVDALDRKYFIVDENP